MLQFNPQIVFEAARSFNLSEKKKLKVKKDILRKLSNRKTKSPERKKLLVQHGGGFLLPLLAPILASLVGGVLGGRR